MTLILRRCLLLLFCISVCLRSYAYETSDSPQLPDYLIYQNDTFSIYNLILEDYLDSLGARNHGSLFELKFRKGATANCWRGYQAIYSVNNGELFLEGLVSCGQLLSDSVGFDFSKDKLSEFFGEEKSKDGRIHLDWYSGFIFVPRGKLLRWDGVFQKTFEQEEKLEFSKGALVSSTEIQNYIDLELGEGRRYEELISEKLFHEILKINWKDVSKFDCSEKYTIKIGESGLIEDVTMTDYRTKELISEFWDRKEYNYCLRTMKKGLKRIKFDIVKNNGVPIEELVILELWFEENGVIENWTN